MHNSLYVGHDVALDHYDGGHDVSIVTFEARNKYIDAIRPSPFGQGFGRGVFAKLGCNEFLVKKSRNHWYQTDEIDDVIRLIIERAGGSRIITYGSSMGGFAAVNFSGALGASSFVAISPLYDIQEGGEVDDARWGDESRILDFKHNFIREGRCKDAHGYVFYGNNEIDARHAACIARETKATIIGVEYGGHPCSFYLNDAYGLKRLVNEIARDEFALDEFECALAENTPSTYYPHLKRSKECQAAKDIDGAIVSAMDAIEFASERADLRRHLGNLLLMRGDLPEAEAAYREAIRITPKDPLTHVRISHAYAAKGDFESAVAAVNTAIRINGQRSSYHLRLGEWLLKKGDLPEAERVMLQAIKLSPSAANARARLSFVYAAMEDYTGAVTAMKEAVDLAPTKPEYYARLGEWLIKSGDLALAAEAMKAVIRLNPSATRARSRLQTIERLMIQENARAEIEPPFPEAELIEDEALESPMEEAEAPLLSKTAAPANLSWLGSASRSIGVKAALAGAAAVALLKASEPIIALAL